MCWTFFYRSIVQQLPFKIKDIIVGAGVMGLISNHPVCSVRVNPHQSVTNQARSQRIAPLIRYHHK
jgi:hypothetical protein